MVELSPVIRHTLPAAHWTIRAGSSMPSDMCDAWVVAQFDVGQAAFPSQKREVVSIQDSARVAIAPAIPFREKLVLSHSLLTGGRVHALKAVACVCPSNPRRHEPHEPHAVVLPSLVHARPFSLLAFACPRNLAFTCLRSFAFLPVSMPKFWFM